MIKNILLTFQKYALKEQTNSRSIGVMLPQAKEGQRGLAKPQKLGKKHGTEPPHSPQKEHTLPTSSFQSSSFQNWERINLCCLNLPVCAALLRQP